MLATTDTIEANGGSDVDDKRIPAPSDGLSASEVYARAEEGDRTVLPELRKLLEAAPKMVQDVGDMAGVALESLLKRATGDNLLAREAQVRYMTNLSRDLVGESPSFLEKLLAERIVLCWFHVHYQEARYAQAHDATLMHEDFYQRYIDRAHRRLIAAIKALAQIRKLGLPALQVNIAAEGGKQVNLLSPPASDMS